MTIKVRLIINTTLATAIVIALVMIGWMSLRSLAVLQNQGNQLAHDAEATALASRAGISQYQTVADAIIIRDMTRADSEWARKKEANAKRIDEMAKGATTPEEKQLVAEARKSFDQIVSLYEGKLRPILVSTPEVTAEMREISRQVGKEVEVIRTNTLKLSEFKSKAAKGGDADFDASMKKAMGFMLIIGLIGLVVQLAAGFLISNSIVKPLTMLNLLIGDLAKGEGDLTHRIDYTRNDELGSLSNNLNLFIVKLHDIVKNVVKDSIQVVIGSSRVHAMSEMITKEADGLATQAAAVATASEEMSATSNDIARNCMQAAEGGTVATSVAADGSIVVQQTVQGMGRIAERVRAAATTVASLGSRSDQIGDIAITIQDIADQTNLLALNAAIEAARAGEQGRGFAVVADEVRALAERTSRATREISEMIKAIQNDTRNAVESMEQGVHEVEMGSADAARSGEALQKITDQINTVTMQINQIATAAEEQTATTTEISGNIIKITEIAQKTTNGTRETTSASHHLLGMSEELMTILGKFKVNEETTLILDRAKSAHMLFIGKIKAHLDGVRQVDPNGLPTHLTCAFGKWYQSMGQQKCGHSALFRQIDAPHAKVHEMGKQAVMAHNAGDKAKAREYCDEMTACSTALVEILERLKSECHA
jgi:methyl-accepting chemotaxis protein